MTTSNKRKLITSAIAAELVLIACTMIIKISHVPFQSFNALCVLTLAGAAIIAVILLFRAVALFLGDRQEARN